jgi:hypothetical protein
MLSEESLREHVRTCTNMCLCMWYIHESVSRFSLIGLIRWHGEGSQSIEAVLNGGVSRSPAELEHENFNFQLRDRHCSQWHGYYFLPVIFLRDSRTFSKLMTFYEGSGGKCTHMRRGTPHVTWHKPKLII